MLSGERMPVTEARELSDAQLIKVVREGDISAFGVLYERHLQPAKRMASCLAGTPTEREDLVAEAFTRVLGMLREGRGPEDEFRPYLLVTLRNAAIRNTRLKAPESLYAEVPDAYAVSDEDPVIDRWQARIAADAYASLPERWRTVLWHTEVENEPQASVAPLLGLRPNGVAALAYRAREGLRQAYLTKHLPEPGRRECRSTVDKLAGFVRHNTPQPLSRKINRHLNTCADCRDRADALTTANNELSGLLGPALLGTSLAAYLHVPAAVGAASGTLAAKGFAAQLVLTLAVAGTPPTAASSEPAAEPIPAVVAEDVHNPTSGHRVKVISGPPESLSPHL